MESRSWISHAEFVITLVAVVGGVLLINSTNAAQISEVRQEIAAQAQRTDRLYEMFVDLLKVKGGNL